MPPLDLPMLLPLTVAVGYGIFPIRPPPISAKILVKRPALTQRR